MKSFLNPKWLLLINTVPILLLLFLGWHEFSIIKSLLNEESLSLWKTFAIGIVVLGGLTLAYSVIQILNNKKITIGYSIVSLVLYLAYLYLYYYKISDILPWNIPDWMSSDNIHLHVSATLMPTLAHSVIVLVVLLTPKLENKTAIGSLIAALLIPIAFYLFGVLILSLWRGLGGEADMHFAAVMLVIGTVVFMFFLVRGLYIIISRRNINPKYALFWKVPISIILPLLGLAVNTTMFSNMFGDFSSPWYFIWAVINGIFICLPSLNNKTYRILLFLGRSITFTFTLYFFIVFLPFLPFSIVAIILIGLGFLMLTPLMLFVIHVQALYNDVLFLKKELRPIIIGVICVVGLAIIPTGMTFSFIRDRNMLNETLEYLYSPDYSKDYTLNKNAVNRVLGNVNERTKSFSMLYSTTPYIESYYRWLVLDNMNLSASRKIMINHVFNGDNSIVLGRSRGRAMVASDAKFNPEIQISEIDHTSRYDEDQQTWISWVDLSIKNNNAPLWEAEYKTRFTLPNGCWISDYYLDVEGVRKKGLLAEKKAATWIFQQIRNVNRDPGLLTYVGGNEIEFKVFPFQEQETRYTGIEFIHKEPVEIIIDEHKISLGNKSDSSPIDNIIVEDVVAYISVDKKTELKKVVRKPYYHFIVDVSVDNKQSSPEDYPEVKQFDKDLSIYAKRIQALLDKDIINKDDAKISYVNSYVETKELEDDWKEELTNKKLDGGFYLDRALKKAMYDNYRQADGSKYPVFVVVSDFWTNKIWNKDIKGLKFTYPDNHLGYTLMGSELGAFDLFASDFAMSDSIITNIPSCEVLEYQFSDGSKVYLPNDSLASVALNPSLSKWEVLENDIKEKDWQSALLQQGQWMHQTLYPYSTKEDWLDLVRNSFKSRIMTPLTSYIVLENEAQETLLIKKQEQVLAGNKNLDLEDESIVRMSEPELYLLLILLSVFLLIMQRKRKF